MVSKISKDKGILIGKILLKKLLYVHKFSYQIKKHLSFLLNTLISNQSHVWIASRTWTCARAVLFEIRLGPGQSTILFNGIFTLENLFWFHNLQKNQFINLHYFFFKLQTCDFLFLKITPFYLGRPSSVRSLDAIIRLKIF